MKTKQRKLEAIQQVVRHGPYRSSLFWWMVDHHDYLVGRGGQGRMPWIELCRMFAEDGLTDGSGKPATPKRAGETWREACAEVRSAADRAATTRSTRPAPPSRQRSDWQPPMSVPASARPEPAREVLPPQAAPSAQPAPGATGSSPLDDLPPEAKAMIDRVRQAFAETDRKRFGRF